MKKQDETCSLAPSTPSTHLSYTTLSSLQALLFSNVPKPSPSVTRVPDNTQTPAQLPSRHFHGLSITFTGGKAACFTTRLLITRALVSVIFRCSLVCNQSSRKCYCVGGPHFLRIKHPQMFTALTLCAPRLLPSLSSPTGLCPG